MSTPSLREALEQAVLTIEQLKAASREPIAIVGVGCRFPGQVGDLESFWKLLHEGREAITTVPLLRWDVEAFYDPDPDAPGKTYTRSGGFVEGIDGFEPAFFEISPREARSLDPQQRLLLEVSWEALEHAGLAADRLMGSKTGVFVGICGSDYSARAMELGSIDAYSRTGNANSVAAGRLSYTLGLKGPCLAVDTACSSSLVAIHLASESLRRGECELALAGGVSLVLSPAGTVYFSKLRALSPDGRCKAFDARANGYVRSEGCGIVLLKRLSSAQANGDRILAIIRGSAVNQDGRSNGLTAPNGPSQEGVIHDALEHAGLSPGDVAYVECHGTGTPLGDPIEVQAIGNALGRGRHKEAPILLGSVKTNIGHAEAAAGVAGLLKVVLALQKERIPRHLHFEEPNPLIPWADLPVAVAAQEVPWPAGTRPRCAGVSSFGYSGTNAHLIVEEAPPSPPFRKEYERPVQLLPLSGRTEKALFDQATGYAQHLEANPEQNLGDVCHTAAVGRVHFEHRLAVVAHSREKVIQKLRALDRGIPPGRALNIARESRPKIVFLFAGQGSQYPGMGRTLYETQPIFRQALDRCAEVMRRLLEVPLLEILYPPEDVKPRLDETAFAQPALFAIAIAIAELWRSWGILPDAVVGQSQGEIAAACVAGALSLEDAAKVICLRSQLLRKVSGRGGMASVGLSEVEARKRIVALDGRLSVAVTNSPTSTVLSGDADALESLLLQLERENVFCRRIKVDYASHTPQMDALRGDLLEKLKDISPREGQVPLYSTVTGEPLSGREVNADYWVRNLRQPVRFSGVVDRLFGEGFRQFVELSPHPTLATALAAWIDSSSDGVWVPSLKRDEDNWTTILESLGELYVRGAKVDWGGFDAPYARRRVSLPTYPFQRQRHWIDGRAMPIQGRLLHPLLGARIPLAGDWIAFERTLTTDALGFLQDHKVFGEVVVPGTAILEMARAAAEQLWGTGDVEVRDVVLQRALVIPSGSSLVLQLHLTPESDGRTGFTVFSGPAGAEGKRFALHASGQILRRGRLEATVWDLDAIRRRCALGIGRAEIYQAFDDSGLTYGPSFQGIQEAWGAEGEAVARLELPITNEGAERDYPIHPALLDAALQTLACARDPSARGKAFLPFEVERFQVSPSGGALWVHARVRDVGEHPGDVVGGELTLVEPTGKVVGEIVLRCKRAEASELSGSIKASPANALFSVAWRPADVPKRPAQHPSGRWLVLGEGELAVALRTALGERLCRDVGSLDRTLTVADRPRPSLAGVIASFDTPQKLSASHPEVALRRAVEGLDQAQWLIQKNAGKPIRLVWVTRAATAASIQADDRALISSPLLGLSRVLRQEHPELGATLIDLDVALDNPTTDAELILGELALEDGEPEVAYRGGRRLVPRLRAQGAEGRLVAPTIRPDASYLITGGLGGLGLQIARWLVEKGAKRLVLLGRTAPGEKGRVIVDALEGAGASVTVAAVDVRDRGQLAAVIAALPAQAPLGGVIHAAGVLDDGVVVEQTAERFSRVLAPKLAGAWNLHTLTEGLALDFFVLFSSRAAMVGAAGQSNYAAANAFLDALAQVRKARGLPAVSIAWGAWTEEGMTSRLERSVIENMERRGFPSIEREAGIALFERALADGGPHLGAFPFDRYKFRTFLGGEIPPLFRDLVPMRPEETRRPDLPAELAKLRPDEREKHLQAILQAEVSKVLALSSPTEVPLGRLFRELGLDSLMAVNLRNRLVSRIGQPLPATVAFTYPTVKALATHLLTEIIGQLPQEQSKGSVDENKLATIFALIDQLGDTDLETFAQRMEEMLKAGPPSADRR